MMEWIQSSTLPNSSWTGSMQLMAGIKACTGRRLANHPHFEDKWLRDRTRRVYQVYGRKSMHEVNKILQNENIDYIILEDSICLAPSTGCSTNDIIDITNGEKIDSDLSEADWLAGNEIRFCERVRYQDEEARKYFILVFVNRTFRVYSVINV
ncbi:unnamed protein product [Dracunculus medinensis]|uniref:Uncharacterized protein n=1 Tax=Dracunculus medinensis TaxID=318479 RepID=A0A3P7PRJ2_DRAME|nr:unnamed protein product [Dracunculus medinensis]